MKQPGPLGLLVLVALLLTGYRAWVIGHLNLDLFVDEAYYWDWAQQLAWGYYSKPPGIAALIALTTALGGQQEWAVRAGSLLLHPLTAGVLFLIARRYSTVQNASMVGMAYLLMPAVAFSSLFISTDVLLLLCWSLALYALVDFQARPARAWLLLGLAVGAGMLSKYSMALFGPSLLLFMVLHPPARQWLRQPYLHAAGLLALLIVAPNVVWNFQHDFPTLRHTAEIAQLAQPGLHWDELLEFGLYQPVLLGPGLFLLWLLALRRCPDPLDRLLISFSVLPLLLFLMQALRGGAHANWAVFAYPAALLLLVRHSRPRHLHGALAINILIMVGLYHHQDLMQGVRTLTGDTRPITQDAFKRLRGWAELGAAVAARQQDHPEATLLGEERDVLAQLRYYVRPTPTVWSWNPAAQLRHHYDLTRSLPLPPPPGTYLFVTRRQTLDDDLRTHFDVVQMLAPIEIAAGPSRRIHAQVFRLQRF